ncbi:hypothetical protein KVT40_006376 [Elsinoe batatas]|uniref:Prokaryotic-type class I peptide chain release factors domain-containing protein n=1 Tax=Elsinoe batatas TaxID=2601811 RepID=A0A8K0L1Z0_9PEZI|nr:hypothetical protein KVT40_006376 [Elsinoe batatas]
MRLPLRPTSSLPTIPRPSPRSILCPLSRPFHPSPSSSAKPLPPLPPLLDSEISETFIKGTGPGGQVINKTSSCVQIKHLPTGLMVKNQSTRSRAQNRSIARKILREKIEEFYLGEGSRVRIKEGKERKRKLSGEKKRRRKYRALAERAEEGHGEGEGEGENGMPQREEGEGGLEGRETEGAVRREETGGARSGSEERGGAKQIEGMVNLKSSGPEGGMKGSGDADKGSEG